MRLLYRTAHIGGELFRYGRMHPTDQIELIVDKTQKTCMQDIHQVPLQLNQRVTVEVFVMDQRVVQIHFQSVAGHRRRGTGRIASEYGRDSAALTTADRANRDMGVKYLVKSHTSPFRNLMGAPE